MSESISSSRRRFLKVSAATAAGVVLPAWSLTKGAPAIIAAESERPQALQDLHLGDPSDGSIVVWSRSDRPARMLVEWSYDEMFREVRRLVGPHALETIVVPIRPTCRPRRAVRRCFSAANSSTG